MSNHSKAHDHTDVLKTIFVQAQPSGRELNYTSILSFVNGTVLNFQPLVMPGHISKCPNNLIFAQTHCQESCEL